MSSVTGRPAPGPEAGRGHPNAEPGAGRLARWGQRWSFELTPDGPDATVVTEIFDCSQVPEDQRVDIDYGNIWVEDMRQTLERLDRLCAGPPGASTPGQPPRLGLAGWGRLWHSCGLRNIARSRTPGGTLNMTLASANARAGSVAMEQNPAVPVRAALASRALRSVTAPMRSEAIGG